ncbi:DUF1642 domain-containing protein [Enterococcus avium]|uniref:DUF1642 domain-containing protein n=2 Tax=Enterococcus avium TaxID=33945 RepID=A0AAV3IWC8_ENTAV|nr:DUF1642 domain-containing protein [Enterococcus avium]EOT45715.1 hypothetical protein OMU_02139 [Enterococcus avium ATCC 14025]EOU16880.1 hypothetical protein I570_04029 [Enterococcus avium ATCC 14025]MDB1750622.1 DUF1642 domain-containing protein [Enterococcus avium]OJG23037.1 hypothetical protein RU95_GL003785 [Enterococcus avium]STP58842.1 Protein of uncharacterised function (DUF1642) [Enterococcus avium]
MNKQDKKKLTKHIELNQHMTEISMFGRTAVVDVVPSDRLIDLIDELASPVKVPKFVGELLDYYRNSTDVDLLALLICFKDWYFRKDKLSENEEAIDWLVRHPEKFMKAWLDGYEVEEEPKWVVKIEDNGSAYFVDFFDELQPHLVYGLSGEVMRFDSEDKANAIVTLIECGTVEKV